MGAVKLILSPGINVQKTPLLNEAGFSACNLIRWKDGLLQKNGGWQKLYPQAFNGICRGMFPNQDINGFNYLAVGTNLALQIYYNSILYDITPVISATDLSSAFSTTSASAEVTVHDVGSLQTAGNGITIVNNYSVGGLILQGFYEITSVIDADNYTITAASDATATITLGGHTAEYDTSIGSAVVTVTLEDHGLVSGNIYQAYLPTSVGGLTITGTYIVDTVIDPDSFTINGGTNASSTSNAFDNSDAAYVNYLLPSGNLNAAASQGYGLGFYGYGFYGYGSQGPVEQPRRWSFAEWGQNDFIASPTDGTLYFWDSSAGVLNNPATEITAAPDEVTSIFLAMPQQQIIALGAEVSGMQDRLLIRWCDIANYNDWTATITNQAGSFRIPSGGRIVGGFQAQQQGLIWTETSLWVMQYTSTPFIYSFNEIGKGCGLIGNAAMGILDSNVYWMGSNNIYRFDGGSVVSIPCPVWDIIFRNLNQAQVDKITCAVNSPFNEITWYFPSSTSLENDMYIKYNTDENLWDYGTLDRTAWCDQSIIGMPIGADTNSFVQQHEISADADGVAMNPWAQTGFFKLSDGLLFIFLERMIPDFILSSGATVKITVFMQNYPTDTPTTYGPFDVNEATQFLMIRGRNRLASIKIESQDLGSFWRLGELIYMGSESGRR